MNLREFVKESLMDLSLGIAEANTEANGRHPDRPEVKFFGLPEPNSAGLGGAHVEFDIAVTLTESSKGKGGGGLRIAVVEAGVGKEKQAGSERVSRLKFSVAILSRIT